jgi:hypothetical protein
MTTDLANELAAGVELEKLCGARPVGGAAGVTTREDEDVSFGVHCHACDFPKIEVRREFQKIRERLVRDLGRRLWEKGTTEHQQ